MSTPGSEFREAEYLGLGFLAVASSELLARLLAGQPIDDDDKYTLRRAKKFLEDASSGAQLVNEGVHSNVSAVETVRKLSYSVEPLTLVHEQIRAAEAGVVLQRLADSIKQAVDTEVIDRANLEVAKNFFRQLHIFFLKLTEAGRRRTGVEENFGIQIMAHA